tara:strand:- start:1319 stop:1765 length:447 start_codon:yes stop_codon:yes gene_type:complete
MSIEAIKEALSSMCRAASMHNSEWTSRMGEINEWGSQCWEIDGERVQELATAYGETTASFIAACNPTAIRSLIERLEAAEKAVAHIAAISHEGGVVKLNEHGAMVYIRRLSLPYWISSGDNAQQEKRVGDAIGSAMAGGLAEGVSDGK